MAEANRALVAKPSQAIHSLPLDDELEDEGPLIAPFGDVTAASETGLRNYIAAFVMEFFRRPPDLFAAQYDIYEMEREYYSRLSGTPIDRTTYGRLFVDLDRPDTSGLSDRGLTVFLLGECLAAALGVGHDK